MSNHSGETFFCLSAILEKLIFNFWSEMNFRNNACDHCLNRIMPGAYARTNGTGYLHETCYARKLELCHRFLNAPDPRNDRDLRDHAAEEFYRVISYDARVRA